MPELRMLQQELVVPDEAVVLVWCLCGLFGLFLAGALGTFVAEMWQMARQSAELLPAREFQGFGRAAPRRRV